MNIKTFFNFGGKTPINNIEDLYDILKKKDITSHCDKIGSHWVEKANSWEELGFEDEDFNQMIISLQHKYRLSIPELIIQKVINMSPSRFVSKLK